MALTRFKPQPTSSPGVPKRMEKQELLYVEDEDINWEVTEFSLREKYVLTRATDAKQVFSLLSKRKFDVILMDIQLAGSDFNGIEITQILKGLWPQTLPSYAKGIESHEARIIFVTAYAARYTKDELVEAGGDDLITKPVDFTRLSLAISRLVVREAFKKQPKVKQFLAERNLSEKRQALRVNIELECTLEFDGQRYTGFISDISIGGARVTLNPRAGRPAPDVGTSCRLVFSTAWGVLETDCAVVRTITAPDDVGIAFTNMPEYSREVLKKWLDNPS